VLLDYGLGADRRKGVTQQLKVHVYLNVGHQRGCKVVTSATSVKLNVFLRSLFIHCTSAELTGIFSDIMNLKDCVGFSDSLVLQQQVGLKTRGWGYLGHGGEGISGKGTLALTL
jgi:hypothetical protein